MAEVVLRTARVRLRATPGQRRRVLGLLLAGGDVWAWVLDVNRQRRAAGEPPVVGYRDLCRELVRHGPFGELAVVGARSVLRRYSGAWFETANRRSRGERAGFPRRKHRFVPVRFYHATFTLDHAAVRLGMARGAAPVRLRLARPAPYPLGQVRSVTLLLDGGYLAVDVTAAVPVHEHDVEAGRVAGVDPGVIHPFAAALADGSQALVVSGRAVRAQHRLHLADTKARAKKMAAKHGAAGPAGAAPRGGSRRWRKLRARQRVAEARHRRRVRQAQHEAAAHVIGWALKHRVGTLVVGDPKGITARDAGRAHNLRLRQWGRTHLLGALTDKAQAAGITVHLADERGTSSACPACGQRVPKPKGRVLTCGWCGLVTHRDVAGAVNIARRAPATINTPSCGAAAPAGTPTAAPAAVEHRRVGTFTARRDRRRHLWQQRSCPALGRPAHTGSRSPKTTAASRSPAGPPGNRRGSRNNTNAS